MTNRISVALVGAGSMGGALLRGWLNAQTIEFPSSAVFDPAADASIRKLTRETGLSLNPSLGDISVDAIVFAVKPQAAASVLPSYARIARSALVISVMAGTSLESIGRALANPPRVARAMPNLPASVGAGVTGLYAPATVNARARDMVDRLMAAAGETVWVGSEKEIDFVTAVSGSGPAYYFLLTEAIAEAGAALGLDREAALRLARATASGSGALLMSDPRSPADMRKAVTSPGGTTAAALGVLDGDAKALRKLMKEAIAAAARRAAELTE
ncbi:MAG: pyrroline-5-carboxylate reductase [Pseudomonadota bacterium]|nr:pyrroline-5-carboxylate reductase [Pseudomonadota bacterium]